MECAGFGRGEHIGDSGVEVVRDELGRHGFGLLFDGSGGGGAGDVVRVAFGNVTRTVVVLEGLKFFAELSDRLLVVVHLVLQGRAFVDQGIAITLDGFELLLLDLAGFLCRGSVAKDSFNPALFLFFGSLCTFSEHQN